MPSWETGYKSSGSPGAPSFLSGVSEVWLVASLEARAHAQGSGSSWPISSKPGRQTEGGTVPGSESLKRRLEPHTYSGLFSAH